MQGAEGGTHMTRLVDVAVTGAGPAGLAGTIKEKSVKRGTRLLSIEQRLLVGYWRGYRKEDTCGKSE